MSERDDIWCVRGALDDLLIELHPRAVDADEAEASVREMRRLVHELRSLRPEARRVLLDLHGRLRGSVDRGARGLAWGSFPVDRVGDDLLLAARTRAVVVRRKERRVATVVLDGAGEEVLGPDPRPDNGPDTKTWVGVVLLDQDGTPVPRRPYRVVQPDGTTVDGTLDANGSAILKGLDPGNCRIWCPYVEPRAETTYVVKAGDHISGIAQRFGFDDYRDVWNAPGNADLQALRLDPHVLQPGDSLVIPEVTAQPAANKPTGAKHPFTIHVSPLRLRVTLLDLLAKPIADAPLTVAGADLTTDGSGLVETLVDKTAQDVTMDSSGTELELELGALNPSDDATSAGWKARLYNLGFLWDPDADDGDDEMEIALEDFQAQYALPLSRQLDDPTKGQLVQVYGC